MYATARRVFSGFDMSYASSLVWPVNSLAPWRRQYDTNQSTNASWSGSSSRWRCGQMSLAWRWPRLMFSRGRPGRRLPGAAHTPGVVSGCLSWSVTSRLLACIGGWAVWVHSIVLVAVVALEG